MTRILLLNFILISTIIFGQARKIDRKVYENYREGNLDLALQELEELKDKYDENAFFHYWRAYIYKKRVNLMKKNEWIEQNKSECKSLITNTIKELEIATQKLTREEIAIDLDDYNILFPGCPSEHITPSNLYSYCDACRYDGVRKLNTKFEEVKVYMNQLLYNLTLEETIKEYISGKQGIESFINTIRPLVKENASKNPLDGEISKQLFLQLADTRNKIILENMRTTRNDKRIYFLKNNIQEEYQSIIPDLEKMINESDFNSITNQINKINTYEKDLIYQGYNGTIESLKKELNELNTDPKQYLKTTFDFTGFSNSFIVERKNLYNQNIQLAIQKKEEYIISEMNKKARFISKEAVSNIEYTLKSQLEECESFLNKYQKYSSHESYNLIIKRKEAINSNINSLINASNKKNEFNRTHVYNQVIEDNFADWQPLQWKENENENYSIKTINGKLIINSKNNRVVNSICQLKLTPGEDKEINAFALSTSTEWQQGTENNSFGIIFGAQGISNCYSFGINANGSYALWRYTDGNYTYSIDWKPSTEINKKGKNVLTIVKNNETIELYINYAKVDTFIITDFFGEEVGLNVSGIQEIGFDDYSISYTATEKYRESKFGVGLNINDIDGKTYKTIHIGKDLWTSENLNTNKFRNGEAIPQAKSKEEWEDASNNGTPCWCYLNFNPANGKIYGKLYNWHAVNDSRGLAPEGWHIATAKDYADLLKHTNNANDLKSKPHWKLKNGTNKFGFSALPGYSLDLDLGYSGNYNYGADRWNFFSASYQSDRVGFWTSTHNPLDFESSSTGFVIYDNDFFSIEENEFKGKGKYVRCVKD